MQAKARTDSNTYFQIFQLDEQDEDWWPQHVRDLNACGDFGAMSNESGNGFAWILNWPERWNEKGGQVTPWGAPWNRESGPQTDEELFSLLREHDIPVLAPASLALEILLLHNDVRIIDPPERSFPFYRGKP